MPSKSPRCVAEYTSYRSNWPTGPPTASPYTREDAEAEQRAQPPCCVCKEEKSKRDECMLFSKSADPAADCRSLVDQYKSCMVGYGFKV
ncbi:unnamed protein product [Clonostachys byssicola]|uniref:Cytochrome c oxidase copper chaperone n=1 Tax=Clonostachys byssicola TaxID=160290 RepID=A0A9N9TZ55_9HYPO|nr:unnamed protein product [Clonostachys byssicola]